MNGNIYTETVTPEELSGEYVGFEAQAGMYDALNNPVNIQGTVTSIQVAPLLPGRSTKSYREGELQAEVTIGGKAYDLQRVHFHYDTAAIRTRRKWHPTGLPANYVERLRGWEENQAPAGERSDTVTIPRDRYDILVATYKTYQQIGQAIGAMGETPKLRPEDVEALDHA